MTLKVYYDLMSQPCRAHFLFLKLSGIPYKDCLVALRKGEHMTEQFAKLNPFQKVPCIEDAGFKLSETQSIFEYLTSKYPVGEHWYPKDVENRARVTEFLSWLHTNLRLFGSLYFRNLVLKNKDFDASSLPLNLESLKRQMEKSLDQLEDVFLSRASDGGVFLNGANKVSVADLWCHAELEQIGITGYDVAVGRPKVANFMKRVRQECGPFYAEAYRFPHRLRHLYVSGKL